MADGPLDRAGALAAIIGLGGLVWAALEAPRLGATHPLVLCGLGAGIMGVAAFLRIEATSPAPMTPLELFRVRAFAGANLLTLLLYSALGGALFFVPFDLIQVQGYSATAAGASLLPTTIASFVLALKADRITHRVGRRVVLTVGPALAALGFGLFARSGVGDSYWTTFFPAALVLGIGIGLTAAPLTNTVMQSVGQDRVGTASGVNNAVARTAGALGLALMALVAAAARSHGSTHASFRVVMLFAAALALGSAVTGWRWLREGRERRDAAKG